MTSKKTIKETPDRVYSINQDHLFYDNDAIGFGWCLDKCYVTANDRLMLAMGVSPEYVKRFSIPNAHSDIKYFYETIFPHIKTPLKGSRGDFKFGGRLWFERKLISFWQYPKTEVDLLQLLSSITEEVYRTYKLKINFSGYHIETESGDIIPIEHYDGSDVGDDDDEKVDMGAEHVKSPMDKNMQDPRRLGYLKSKKIKLPQGMTQAEYNSKIMKSESVNQPYGEKTKNKTFRQGLVDYEIGVDSATYGHVIGDAGVMGEDVDPNTLNLSSFKKNNTLNPQIWVNNAINSRVRLRLLDIADDFIETLNVGWAKPKDIIITGSIANFNWSKYSDVDLHILYDFKEIDEKVEFVKGFFDAQKQLWNNEHDNLKIYGFPVELYVQDINDEHTSSGVYSIETNKWLTKPNEGGLQNIQLDKFTIKEKCAHIMNSIDEIVEKFNPSMDSVELEKLMRKLNTTITKIKHFRRASLSVGGEMGVGNIVFKLLRRMGYINKLYELRSKIYDYSNSLNNFSK